MLFPENDLNEINNNHLELPLPGARFEWSHNLKQEQRQKLTEELCSVCEEKGRKEDVDERGDRRVNPFCAI